MTTHLRLDELHDVVIQLSLIADTVTFTECYLSIATYYRKHCARPSTQAASARHNCGQEETRFQEHQGTRFNIVNPVPVAVAVL